MKKLLLIASAFLALVACNKEPIETPVQKEGPSVLTFRSEKPQLDPSTKTEWNGTTIIWSSGDQMRVGYTFNGNWMGQSTAGAPKFYVSNEVTIDGSNSSIGTFSVPAGEGSGQFIDQGEGTYVFYSFFPKSAGDASAVSSDGIATLTLPDSQTPVASSFDKSADIMIGKTASLALEGLPEDPIEISWSRIVAHADLTFSNLAFDGTEKVSEITLTSSGKLAGTFTVDLANGTITTGDDALNTIIIKGDNLTINGNSVEAWCGVLPGEFTSIGVVVKTDKATYTKDITGISGKAFKKNARNTLTINMSGANRTDLPADDYSLYSGDLTEGDYIIYDEADGHALKAEISSNRFAFTDITPNGNVISTNDASIVWHISKSGDYYTIYNASVEKYAAATGSKNQGQLLADGSDDKSLWTVSGSYDFINKDRAASSSNPDNKYLRSNGGSGFACYASGTGQSLTLYKYDSREPLSAPASVSAELNENDDTVIDVAFSAVTNAGSYVIVATPESGDPVEKSITASPASISVADGLNYSTTYTISVYAVPAANDSNHKKSSATSAEGSVTTGDKPANPEGYELITSVADVSSGNYLIVAKVSNEYYAMPNDFATQMTGGLVTVINDFVSSDNASNYVISLTKNDSDYTISSGNVVLGYGSSTSFSTSATGNAALWTITDGTKGTFRIANKGTNTRALAFRSNNSNKKFGAYATSNITPTGEYYDVELFKFNGTIKTNPTTSITPQSPIALTVGGTQQLTVTTNSDGDVSYESSTTSVATVTSSGLITAIAAGTATITISTAETSAYNAGSTTVTVNVSAGASTISQVLTNGAGVYTINNLLVYSVVGNQAIVGDNTGKMVLYKSNHGLEVGDNISIASATVDAFNGVLQIQGGSFIENSNGNTVDHGTATNLNDATVASSTNNTYSATGYHAATYVTLSGNKSDRSITGKYASLYLSAANSSLNGKSVIVTGYIYYYNASHSNYSFQLVSISEDNTVPTVSVSPASLSWAAAETGSKTITITLNGGAAAGDYSYSVLDGNANDWNLSDNASGTITVSPKAANTSTIDAKTLTLRISHTGDNTVYKDVTCTQAKASSGGGGTLTLDFENAASSYSDWTITTIVTQQTSSGVSGHSGSYYGDTDGKTTGSIVTKNKIASPATLTFYISKESTNTTASSWLIKVSTDGSTWTQVGDAQSASSGITKGAWTEVTRNLSAYLNVYVKIEYSGTAAVRCIDDISLTYSN